MGGVSQRGRDDGDEWNKRGKRVEKGEGEGDEGYGMFGRGRK